MSRATFLARLRQGLQGLSPAEIDDIVQDYAAIFEEAAAAGRSEPDLEASLGDPVKLGRELRRQANMASAAGPAEESAPVRSMQRPKTAFRTAMLIAVAAVAVFAASAAVYVAIGSSRAKPSRKMSPPPAVRVTGAAVSDLGTIDQPTLTVEVRDDGRLTASGKVGELTLRVTGHGTAKLGTLKASKVNAIVGDNGRAELAPVDRFNAKLSGSSVTRLYSRPKSASKLVSDAAQLIEAASR